MAFAASPWRPSYASASASLGRPSHRAFSLAQTMFSTCSLKTLRLPLPPGPRAPAAPGFNRVGRHKQRACSKNHRVLLLLLLLCNIAFCGKFSGHLSDVSPWRQLRQRQRRAEMRQRPRLEPFHQSILKPNCCKRLVCALWRRPEFVQVRQHQRCVECYTATDLQATPCSTLFCSISHQLPPGSCCRSHVCQAALGSQQRAGLSARTV